MSFPGLPSNPTPERVKQVVNRINSGKINACIDVTLNANAASTTIADARLANTSSVLFDPMTAHAAAELAAGTLYVTAANRGNGSWILTHANAATTDRTFRLTIIG